MKHLGARGASRHFVADTSGATAVEYGLVASGICVAIAGVVAAMSDVLVAMFTSVLSMFG